MKSFLLSVTMVLVVIMAVGVESNTFTRCGLVRALYNERFPKRDIGQWVCLVEAVSERQTHLVGPVQADGSRDYGFFQINSRFWCSTTKRRGRKGCRVRCKDLAKDNIRQAARCAKQIYRRHGFGVWPGWRESCQGPLPKIKGC